MMFGIDPGIINMIQSILLVISALLILIAVVGVLRIDRNLDNVVYARIHILGIVDIAGIIAFLALGQPLFALIYLFLAPLLAHALANAYFHSEDTLNNPVLNPNLEETSDEEEDEDETDLVDEVLPSRQDVLDFFIVLPGYYWLVDILEYCPFFFRIFNSSFMLEIRRPRFEIDHVTAVFLPCQNISYELDKSILA